MKACSGDQINKILVLKWSALGDVIISSAIFEDLRRAFPDAEIDLQTSPAYQHLFLDDPRFDDVITIDLKGTDRGLLSLWRLVAKTRSHAYDLVLDLQSNDRSRLFLSLLRISSCGRTKMTGLHSHYPYHCAPGREAPAGFIRQQLALKAIGVDAVTCRARLHVPESNRERCRALMQQHGLSENCFAIFLPGSHAAGKLKRWGAQRYASLADMLAHQGRGPAVLIGGPDDIDECAEIAALVGNPDNVVNLCSQTEILDIVVLAEQASFVVGNDTGPGHVASAAGTPMLILCGPTDPRRVKPAGEHVETLQAELACVNCYRKECDHYVCMESITVEMVLQKIHTMVVETAD